MQYQDEPQQGAMIAEPLPEYGQVQGEKVKLAGLDFSLLKQNTIKDKKKDFLSSIKDKLQSYNFKMPLETTTNTHKLTYQNDSLTKNIMMASSIKPSISQNTFYLFPTQMNFAPLEPEVITRRFGKMHSEPLYINHSEEQINKFLQLQEEDDRNKLRAKEKSNKVNKILVQHNENQSESDSDDIFGASENSESPKIKIKIGNKLDLNVNDNDIFARPTYKQAVQEAQQAPKIVDKFDFLRKRRKLNQDQDDGYGQCYNNVGPSLDEMRELKKQGIQLFGDAKQFTKKQRKYDINRDYESIKRVIQSKSKKANQG